MPHWPRVCRKAGGKSLKRKKGNSASTRVAAALRMAALALRRSPTALGAYYRRLARRIGGDVACMSRAGSFKAPVRNCVSATRGARFGLDFVDMLFNRRWDRKAKQTGSVH